MGLMEVAAFVGGDDVEAGGEAGTAAYLMLFWGQMCQPAGTRSLCDEFPLVGDGPPGLSLWGSNLGFENGCSFRIEDSPDRTVDSCNTCARTGLCRGE